MAFLVELILETRATARPQTLRHTAKCGQLQAEASMVRHSQVAGRPVRVAFMGARQREAVRSAGHEGASSSTTVSPTRKRKRERPHSLAESSCCRAVASTSFRAMSASSMGWLLLLVAASTWSLQQPEPVLTSSSQEVHLTGTNRTERGLHAASAATTSLVRVVSGQRLELQCPLRVDLQPDRIIVWMSEGMPLERLDPRRRIIQSNATLNIANAQAKLDDQSFECALVHREHMMEPLKVHRFRIRLLVAPKVAPFECPPEAQVGMRLVLTCSVLEGQQPLSFIWLKDGQVVGLDGSSLSDIRRPFTLGSLHQHQRQEKLSQLETSSSTSAAFLEAATIQLTPGPAPKEPELSLLEDERIRVRQAEDYSILTIDKLELRHEGKYTCSVENEAARLSHSAQLAINAPPILTVEPSDRELVAGQSSVLDCAATGQPRPIISWLRARESNLKQLDYVHVYDSLRYTSLSNGSLLLANVSHREQGFYLCTARNGFGPEVSKLVRVNVHEPASFPVKYQTLEVRSGERANLVCAALGELPVQLEWLDPSENPIQKQDKRFIIDEQPAATNSPQESSHGAGPQSASGPPTNGSVSSRLILARSGRSDSGHYTCQATNKYGSDKMVTNLLVLDVPEKASALQVTNVSATSVLLRWQLAFTGNAPVTSYLIQYQSEDPLDDLLLVPQVASPDPLTLAAVASSNANSAVSSALKSTLDMLSNTNQASENANSPEEAIDRSLVEISVEQSATNVVVRELHPCRVYRFRLAAVNRIGLGEFSEWVRAKTDEAAPSGSAARLVASATGPNSVKVSWLPPDRRTWNGQLIGFNVGYRPLDASLELNKTVEWTPADFHSMLGHSNVAGSSANEASQQNLRDPAKSKQLLRQHLRQLLSVQQQELVAHLTNLQRSTTYLVWIQAVNGRGLGPQSHAISVRTLDDVPPSAPVVRVQTSSHTSVTVSWTLLGNFVSPANQYSLFYRRLATSDQMADITEPEEFQERSITSQQVTSVDLRSNSMASMPVLQRQPEIAQSYQQFMYTLNQLECGSSYQLYMITRNSVGKSEHSQMVTARTLGEPPVAPSPKQSMFLHIGPAEVALNLAAWSTGGCPLTHMSIRYKLIANTSSSSSTPSAGAPQSSGWSLTNNLPQPLLDALNKLHSTGDSLVPEPMGPAPEPIFLIKNLSPNTCYQLQVVAGNAAGEAEAQYEFITAGTNGLGGGSSPMNHLTRKEAGVLPQLHAESPSDTFGGPNNPRQMLPLALLLVLCLVCLILGAGLCYTRLLSFKKRPSSSNNAANTHSPSFSSMDKSWRLRNQLLDRWPLSGSPQGPVEAAGQALHYCGSPADLQRQPNHLSATLNHKNPSSTSFCQSVSMRDFSLVGQQPQQQQQQRATEPQLVSSSTLTTAAKRLHQTADLNAKSATLRPNQALYEMGPTPGQICSMYSNTCKRNIQNEAPTLNNQQDLYNGPLESGSSPQVHHLCTVANCPTGSYGCSASAEPQLECHQGNYAIPSSQQTEISKQIVEYGAASQNYSQANIEACIQQLMEQQYQQQQQQQQQEQQHYAMIVNQKLETAKCHGGGVGGLSEAGGCVQTTVLARHGPQMGPSSLIDSSSASSGVSDLNAGASSATGSSQLSSSGCNPQQQQSNLYGLTSNSQFVAGTSLATPGKLFGAPTAANNQQPNGFQLQCEQP